MKTGNSQSVREAQNLNYSVRSHGKTAALPLKPVAQPTRTRAQNCVHFQIQILKHPQKLSMIKYSFLGQGLPFCLMFIDRTAEGLKAKAAVH